MAIKAQFTRPVQVVETPEMRERIKKIADGENISQAKVMRELHEHGIDWRERVHAERMSAT